MGPSKNYETKNFRCLTPPHLALYGISHAMLHIDIKSASFSIHYVIFERPLRPKKCLLNFIKFSFIIYLENSYLDDFVEKSNLLCGFYL